MFWKDCCSARGPDSWVSLHPSSSLQPGSFKLCARAGSPSSGLPCGRETLSAPFGPPSRWKGEVRTGKGAPPSAGLLFGARSSAGQIQILLPAPPAGRERRCNPEVAGATFLSYWLPGRGASLLPEADVAIESPRHSYTFRAATGMVQVRLPTPEAAGAVLGAPLGLSLMLESHWDQACPASHLAQSVASVFPDRPEQCTL